MRGRTKLGLFIALGTAALFAWYYKIPGLAYHWASMQAQASEWQDKSVWLPRYRVTLEGLPIQGLTENASGLTFNARTGTLFSVINRPAQVAELTTDGRLVRLIPISGAKDPEGITHVEDDLFIIADEREGNLHWVRITPDTKTVVIPQGPRLGLGFDMIRNLGLEGVSWDHVGHRLFVVNEKWPLRILMVSGLKQLIEDGEFDLHIREWKSSPAASLFMADLSSLTLHERTGTLLMLSHESAMVVEYGPDGGPISMMPLWRGFHGLSETVPQAEGLAVGEDGTLYVMSEPNLLYRFEPVGARPAQ